MHRKGLEEKTSNSIRSAQVWVSSDFILHEKEPGVQGKLMSGLGKSPSRVTPGLKELETDKRQQNVSQGHTCQHEASSAGQIWDNLNIKMMKDTEGS